MFPFQVWNFIKINYSALVRACENDQTEIVKLLLEHEGIEADESFIQSLNLEEIKKLKKNDPTKK